MPPSLIYTLDTEFIRQILFAPGRPGYEHPKAERIAK